MSINSNNDDRRSQLRNKLKNRQRSNNVIANNINEQIVHSNTLTYSEFISLSNKEARGIITKDEQEKLNAYRAEINKQKQENPVTPQPVETQPQPTTEKPTEETPTEETPTEETPQPQPTTEKPSVEEKPQPQPNELPKPAETTPPQTPQTPSVPADNSGPLAYQEWLKSNPDGTIQDYRVYRAKYFAERAPQPTTEKPVDKDPKDSETPTTEQPAGEKPTENELPKDPEAKEPNNDNEVFDFTEPEPTVDDEEGKGEDDANIRNKEEETRKAAEEEQKKKQAERDKAIENYEKSEKVKAQERLRQAEEAEKAAREKYNQNPDDPENQKALSEAIKNTQDAQAEVFADDKMDEAYEAAKQEMIAKGELQKEVISNPPGQVSINAEWLKSNRSKYKDVRTLIASQDRPSERKYINFKQDYVVLIRKKPFYASTAQQRYATADVYETHKTKNGTVIDELTKKIQTKGEALKDAQGRTIDPENNYLRAYQINNFMNISINTTVNAPGTCSVTMKGAERVVSMENDQQSKFGFFSWSDLAGSWLNINEGGAVDDGTGIDYTTGSGFGNEDVQRQNLTDRERGIVSNTDSSKRKETYSGVSRTSGASWKQATSQWDSVFKISTI